MICLFVLLRVLWWTEELHFYKVQFVVFYYIWDCPQINFCLPFHHKNVSPRNLMILDFKLKCLIHLNDFSYIIKPVDPKRNQPWIFIGSADAEAEAPMLWPPNAKSQLTGKDPDAGKDRMQEKKVTTEDEMVGCHHWLNGHEFEQTLGYSEGQRRLPCCSPWDCKESDMT